MINNLAYFCIAISPITIFYSMKGILLGISIIKENVTFSYFDDKSLRSFCYISLMLIGKNLADYFDGTRNFLYKHLLVLLFLGIIFLILIWINRRTYIIYNVSREGVLINLITLLEKSNINFLKKDYTLLLEGMEESKIVINNHENYIKIELIKCWKRKNIRILMKEFIKDIKLYKSNQSLSRGKSELRFGFILFMLEVAFGIYLFSEIIIK